MYTAAPSSRGLELRHLPPDKHHHARWKQHRFEGRSSPALLFTPRSPGQGPQGGRGPSSEAQQHRSSAPDSDSSSKSLSMALDATAEALRVCEARLAQQTEIAQRMEARARAAEAKLQRAQLCPVPAQSLDPMAAIMQLVPQSGSAEEQRKALDGFREALRVAEQRLLGVGAKQEAPGEVTVRAEEGMIAAPAERDYIYNADSPSDLLGSGERCCVYRARSRQTGSADVALKCVKLDGNGFEGFKHELKIMRACHDHPHIVKLEAVYFSQEQDLLQVVMELMARVTQSFISGPHTVVQETLFDWINTRGRLTSAEASAALGNVASALEHIHCLGVIHR